MKTAYAWQVSGGDPLEEARCLEGFEKNSAFTEVIVRGVRDRAPELKLLISPHLDREFAKLSPVERAILYIGAFELASHSETPFKVVINEAIELGKSFGAAEGHRFVNGVLEKLAVALRPEEVARSRRIA